jgi:putative endonuclease
LSFRSEAEESASSFASSFAFISASAFAAIAIAIAIAIDYTAIVPTRDDYEFYVYILSSRSHTLYIGVTRHLRTRVLQHREKKPGSFTARYNIDRLVYFERFQYISNAIAREKELKDWNRPRKIQLIENTNPTWQDLAADI